MTATSLIVRPEGKCQRTVEQFRQADLPAIGLALIEIEQHQAGIDKMHAGLFEQVDVLLVVSTYAAEALLAFPALNHVPLCLCVGKSTARILHPLFPNIIVPEIESSEGLLALPELQQVDNKQIVIAKGVGGRPLLEETLIQRGALVECYDLYERVSTPKSKIDLSILKHDFEYVIVTSVELLNALLELTTELNEKYWIVTSQRIADVAYAKRVNRIYVSQSARDNDLIVAIHQLEQPCGRN
jgi:uroporphyrinogen-III synthase